MPAANRSKIVPYILVVPSPPIVSPSPPPSPLNEPIEDNDYRHRRRHDEGGLFGPNCNCLPAFLAGFGIISLLAAAIAIPVVISLSMSTSTTATTTVTTAVPTTTTVTDTTTTATTTTSTESTTTLTNMTCSPTCTSQQTCVNGICVGIGYLSITATWSRSGDGDLVVATPNNKIIYYSNRGPSPLTDQGELDVDNTAGKGPENVFWPNNSTVPPTGTYYVCFSQYYFFPSASLFSPITATAKIVRSTNTTLIFTKTFTTTYKDTTQCDSSSNTLLGSFTYP